MQPQTNRIDLWAIARHLVSLMSMALGSPAALAAQKRLSPRAKRDVLDWLAPFECLVRKLLLLEARTLPRPSARPPARKLITKKLVAALSRPRKPKPEAPFDSEHPSRWRVSFIVAIPRDPLKMKPLPIQTAARIRPMGHLLVRDIWRDREALGAEADQQSRVRKRRDNLCRNLAERYEALRRVVFDPAPHAERLAQRLWRARLAAPFMARRLAEAPPPRRVALFDDAFVALAPLLAAAGDAFWPLNSS